MGLPPVAVETPMTTRPDLELPVRGTKTGLTLRPEEEVTILKGEENVCMFVPTPKHVNREDYVPSGYCSFGGCT